MNTKRTAAILIVVLGLLLTLSVGLGAARVAQEDGTPADPAAVNARVELKIPVQGRLTTPAGLPLDGNYNVAFRVYDVQNGGTPLCGETIVVGVDNGCSVSELVGPKGG